MEIAETGQGRFFRGISRGIWNCRRESFGRLNGLTRETAIAFALAYHLGRRRAIGSATTPTLCRDDVHVGHVAELPESLLAIFPS